MERLLDILATFKFGLLLALWAIFTVAAFTVRHFIRRRGVDCPFIADEGQSSEIGGLRSQVHPETHHHGVENIT